MNHYTLFPISTLTDTNNSINFFQQLGINQFIQMITCVSIYTKLASGKVFFLVQDFMAAHLFFV